jgi:hypothetical protein
LINAEAPQMLMIANMIVSGTNAKTTMVIKTSHAQPKMHHIASNRTDNSIQDIAVHSKPIKSSVCHLLKKASKTEPIFLNALSLTMKTDVLIMKHANGKERRLCAMTPQDGKLRMALDALPLLRNSVLTETSQQDSLSTPHLFTTTQLTTAANAVNVLLKRFHDQLFQLTQILSTTNVPPKRKIRITTE